MSLNDQIIQPAQILGQGTISALGATEIESALQGKQVVTTTGSGGSYIAAPATPWTEYAGGALLIISANHQNPAGATINVSGLGVKNIYKRGADSSLTGGEIKANCLYELRYTETGYFVLVSAHTLAPDDIPAKRLFLAAKHATAQSITTSYTDPLEWATATQNDFATVSGTRNTTMTMTSGGSLKIWTSAWASGASVQLQVWVNGAAVRSGSVYPSLTVFVTQWKVAPGDVVIIKLYAQVGTVNMDGTTPDLSYLAMELE